MGKLNHNEINHFMLDTEHQPEETFNRLLIADKLYFSMMEGVLITDIRGNIQFINPSYSKITGYGNEIIGENPRILKSGKQDKDFYRKMWKSVVGKGTWQGEIWNRRKNGELYLQWTTIARITDDHGAPIYYASVISDITDQKIEETRMKEDLRLATEVQKRALSKPLKDQHIHIEAIYQPSKFLGGDMYNWYKIDDNLYGIMLIDVMGHGVASSIVCMSVHSLLKGIILKCKEPASVLHELNQHMNSLFREEHSKESSSKNYYLTCIYLLVDTKERTIKYASAGHPPGFLITQNKEVTELDKGSIPIGLLTHIDIEVGIYHYEQNLKIVLYTDGIAENAKYGTRENIEILKQMVVKNAHLQPSKLMNRVSEEAQKDGLDFHDDVTMVTITLYAE